MISNSFVLHILDQLAALGNVRARKMFGGFGIYKDGIFFAIIADHIVFFKTNKTTAQKYERLGSKPFTYERDGKIIALNYWELPVEILENRAELEEFALEAFTVAMLEKKTLV